MAENEQKYFKIDECEINFSDGLYGYNCKITDLEKLESIGRIMYLVPSFKKSLDQTLSQMKIPKPDDIKSKVWDKIFVEISLNNRFAKYKNNLNFALSCNYLEGCKISFSQGGHSMSLEDLSIENMNEELDEAKETLEKSANSLLREVRREEKNLKIKEYYKNFSEECKKLMKQEIGGDQNGKN